MTVLGEPGRYVVRGNDWSDLDDARPASPPTVSVVVPYYRAQGQLDLVLAGLAAQTHPATRLQVVVADDGSPEPPRVPAGVVVVGQEDRGFRAAAARNLGARAADGDVLLFVDGDTVPAPTYVEELAALPSLVPDALVTGRRRHADLTGWTPERVRAWFAGGPAPEELTEPAWLREAGSLLDADDRSYRFVISAVMGLGRSLFEEVGGFDETFDGYGGEDWELAHRLFAAGAVLAHRERAVAWHDGPDWGLRGDDPVAAQREKNAETRSLARLLPDPAARGVGGWWRFPDVVARLAPGVDVDATVLGVRSLLAAGLDLQVWGVDPDLLDGDPRVHAGEPPAAVLARCRTQVALSGPLLWPTGELARLVDLVRPGGVGRLLGDVDGVAVEVAATRALRRCARSGVDMSTLFGESRVDMSASAPGPHPDLAHHLPRL
ncbi:Glycosyl transferase family 2 [Klenkia marina]|uniref:Glycosyl transferase family 2 n=1 Tax=Klenkia marina TaxID=1960309 RepID=A0A1G4XXC9_9ACTN|nr:glycosyltransferase [Klenkia marina]SCX45861.1 Glycosyl transferase family 2 [Klenkia marina]